MQLAGVSGVDRLEIVDGLVNVLRALTTRHQPITRLDIRYTFHPSMHRSLLELLATHTSIKHLSLELNNMPRDTFKAIIETLMKSNTALKTLIFFSKYFSVREIDTNLMLSKMSRTIKAM